ncbi:MAG: hypothetical protein E6Q40_08360 [Cupriavidus sp.]|nr:MAG: hypothetical protein E6Q40_08360 [Cupriavidus sp.]
MTYDCAAGVPPLPLPPLPLPPLPPPLSAGVGLPVPAPPPPPPPHAASIVAVTSASSQDIHVRVLMIRPPVIWSRFSRADSLGAMHGSSYRSED